MFGKQKFFGIKENLLLQVFSLRKNFDLIKYGFEKWESNIMNFKKTTTKTV